MVRNQNIGTGPGALRSFHCFPSVSSPFPCEGDVSLIIIIINNVYYMEVIMLLVLPTCQNGWVGRGSTKSNV